MENCNKIFPLLSFWSNTSGKGRFKRRSYTREDQMVAKSQILAKKSTEIWENQGKQFSTYFLTDQLLKFVILDKVSNYIWRNIESTSYFSGTSHKDNNDLLVYS